MFKKFTLSVTTLVFFLTSTLTPVFAMNSYISNQPNKPGKVTIKLDMDEFQDLSQT